MWWVSSHASRHDVTTTEFDIHILLLRNTSRLRRVLQGAWHLDIDRSSVDMLCRTGLRPVLAVV